MHLRYTWKPGQKTFLEGAKIVRGSTRSASWTEFGKIAGKYDVGTGLYELATEGKIIRSPSGTFTAKSSAIGKAWNAAKVFMETPAGKILGVAGAAYGTYSSLISALDDNNGALERAISGIEATGYGVTTGALGYAATGAVVTAVTGGASAPVTLPAAAGAAVVGTVSGLGTLAVSEIARDGAMRA